MKIVKFYNSTLNSRWSLGATLLAGALVMAPLSGAVAQDERLPDLEGTTYGVMLQDLEAQVERLENVPADEREEAMHQTLGLMAQQNLTMIRMIDAVHDKVNGLIEDDAQRVDTGFQKFEDIGAQYGRIRGRHGAAP